MPKFNKLKNNESEFPHIDNVNVYKFDNEFDYMRYDTIQMHLQICTVPWDVGEAHVGQRTISGIGNVVWFETKAKRDAWFDAIPNDQCYRLDTKYKELHSEQTIDVPIPFDVCAKFNYLRVQYEPFANDESYIQYGRENGLRDWFWFIREVEFISPNNTRLHLLDDAFQTWMYDVNIGGMILERGHAPMFAMKADQYLQNPLDNNTYLLTEDVNFGDAPSQVKHIDALALNSNDMYACIATTSNPQSSLWGSKAGNDWRVPAPASVTSNGAPSVYVFAMRTADLALFLANVTNSYPQFKQTVQGVFFASSDLMTLQAEFTFAGVTCWTVNSSRKTLDLCELKKSLFGYETRYQNIAKLYTSPYAHIEITDENGSVDVIKIEDTTGNIDVSVSLSLAYPFITIDAHLLGTGGNARASVTFRNVTSHTFDIGGAWYETLHSWNVPTFAVILDPAREYDYSTHFDRAQKKIDYETQYSNSIASINNAYTNALASNLMQRDNAYDSADNDNTNAKATNATAQTNANNSADTAEGNAKRSNAAVKNNEDAAADTLVTNVGIQTAANTAITSRSNSSALTDASQSNGLSQALQAWEAGFTRETAMQEVEASYETAAIGAAGGAINSAVSGAASGAMSGGIFGAIGGAIGGLVNGAIGGATSMAQTAVSANLTSSKAELTVGLSQSKVDETSNNNNDRTTNQNSANTDNTDTANSASTGTSANSAATQKANASRTQTAGDTNATDSASTERTNASNTKTTNDANADRTQTTAKGNAARTKTTNDTITTNDRDTDTANAGRTRDRAISAISNEINQAALREPFIYGTFANGESATNKPMALFANIITQSKSAISSAGDEFLRYGYMFDKQWEFNGNFNVGKYFTYWKLKDFWVYALNVPDMYMDKLRFFLFGGVTIWRRPEDIGHISVYDNFS